VPTRYILHAEGDTLDVDLALFQQSLALGYQVHENDGRVYLTVPSAVSDDPRCQYLADRELDRLFFVTCVRLTAERCSSTVAAALTIRYPPCQNDVSPPCQNDVRHLPL
jgi:hypothetical protein